LRCELPVSWRLLGDFLRFGVGVRRVPVSAGGVSVAVRWYLRYGLSYRDVEELLSERGVTVDPLSVYRNEDSVVERALDLYGLLGHLAAEGGVHDKVDCRR
jgi:hypothetical protein